MISSNMVKLCHLTNRILGLGILGYEDLQLFENMDRTVKWITDNDQQGWTWSGYQWN